MELQEVATKNIIVGDCFMDGDRAYMHIKRKDPDYFIEGKIMAINLANDSICYFDENKIVQLICR